MAQISNSLLALHQELKDTAAESSHPQSPHTPTSPDAPRPQTQSSNTRRRSLCIQTGSVAAPSSASPSPQTPHTPNTRHSIDVAHLSSLYGDLLGTQATSTDLPRTGSITMKSSRRLSVVSYSKDALSPHSPTPGDAHSPDSPKTSPSQLEPAGSFRFAHAERMARSCRLSIETTGGHGDGPRPGTARTPHDTPHGHIAGGSGGGFGSNRRGSFDAGSLAAGSLSGALGGGAGRSRRGSACVTSTEGVKLMQEVVLLEHYYTGKTPKALASLNTLHAEYQSGDSPLSPAKPHIEAYSHSQEWCALVTTPHHVPHSHPYPHTHHTTGPTSPDTRTGEAATQNEAQRPGNPSERRLNSIDKGHSLHTGSGAGSSGRATFEQQQREHVEAQQVHAHTVQQSVAKHGSHGTGKGAQTMLDKLRQLID